MIVGGGTDACVGGEILGYNTVGSSTDNIGDTDPAFAIGHFVAPCTGDLDNAYLYDAGTTGNAKIAVYETDGSGIPSTGDSLVAMSATLSSTTDNQWSDTGGAFASGSVTKGHTYFLVIFAPNTWYYKANTGAVSSYDATCTGYTSAPDPLYTATGGCDGWGADSNEKVSLYVTLK